MQNSLIVGAGAALAALLIVSTAHAADVQVGYTVDDKALKTAVSGTAFTFELYSDGVCTTAVDSTNVTVDAVDLIERVKRFKPKGGVKPPNTARIVEVLTGVATTPTLYLKVTGTGITPVGGDCQLQYATGAGTSLPCASQVGSEVYFDGCNVNVRSGAGATNATVNGLGNLLVGYDESSGDDKTGSHNLVVGGLHTYSSYGGFVAGEDNTVSDPAASVSGGVNNTASSYGASVSGGVNNAAFVNDFAWVGGGFGNSARGYASAVSGGRLNRAMEEVSSVSGGEVNTAQGYASSVSGGAGNVADADDASVSGGRYGTARGPASSVSGGEYNFAYDDAAAVSGGQCNVAGTGPAFSCPFSSGKASVSGGLRNIATGDRAAVCGGQDNKATNAESTVSGGLNNLASGFASSVTGGASNTASGGGSSVSGGLASTASGSNASVSGGFNGLASAGETSVTGGHSNVASGTNATVSGGFTRSAPGLHDWRAGNLFEDF